MIDHPGVLIADVTTHPNVACLVGIVPRRWHYQKEIADEYGVVFETWRVEIFLSICFDYLDQVTSSLEEEYDVHQLVVLVEPQ